ncbi:cryptococcal mannosyltransferase 1-domain-containing protein [Auriculariales sp. MPI-PUGE-AT-0066]|nr:cryptococcal mannosyltransferase 1-domain-containing protein [Auriculariales sp. MPI-PUGE-AT-0066]
MKRVIAHFWLPRPVRVAMPETSMPVYIAAIFHNNDKVLPHWTQEMLRLVQYIGTDNVFLSLVESYSTDNTPELLKSFGATLTQMRVPHRIIINDTSILRPPKIVSNVARVDFLAATRNLALEPLRSRRSFARGRVLFSNDVYVTAEAMVELLNTRDGDYDIACGMDFDDFGLYDVWVTRDRVGGMVAGVWPFLLEPSGRRSIERNEPAQVFTCWNGIIALRAEPFLPPALRLDNSSSKLSEKPLHPALPSSHPGYQNGRTAPPRNAPALQFRASGWEECFSSESFLLGYDMRRQFALMQVYLNPRVVTAYHRRFFFWNNYVLRHWLVRWWMRNVEGGRNLHRARIVLSKVGARGVTLWDGGACQGTWET